MPMLDGVDYEHSKRFDSDEEIDAFLEKMGNKLLKSDRSYVGPYLTVFWSCKSNSRSRTQKRR